MYTAVATPSGKARISVTTIVKKEPATAPKMPASSGSRESPAVKNRVLNFFSTASSAIKASTQAICLSLMRRSDSGTSRGINPLSSMSTSSPATSQISRLVPIVSGFEIASFCRSKAAPGLTMAYSERLSRRTLTSGKRSRSADLTTPPKSPASMTSGSPVPCGSIRSASKSTFRRMWVWTNAV